MREQRHFLRGLWLSCQPKLTGKELNFISGDRLKKYASKDNLQNISLTPYLQTRFLISHYYSSILSIQRAEKNKFKESTSKCYLHFFFQPRELF